MIDVCVYYCTRQYLMTVFFNADNIIINKSGVQVQRMHARTIIQNLLPCSCTLFTPSSISLKQGALQKTCTCTHTPCITLFTTYNTANARTSMARYTTVIDTHQSFTPYVTLFTSWNTAIVCKSKPYSYTYTRNATSFIKDLFRFPGIQPKLTLLLDVHTSSHQGYRHYRKEFKQKCKFGLELKYAAYNTYTCKVIIVCIAVTC